MKTLFYTLLLIITCSIISFGQKKYIVKITTLDNHKRKGLLFHVDDKGVYILPKSVRRLSENKVEDLKKAVFIDFRTIKEIKVRRKSSVEKGQVIGSVSGLLIGFVIAKNVINNYDKNRQPDNTGVFPLSSSGFNAFGAYITLLPLSTSVGGGLGGLIGGHYPHQFKVESDSTSFQTLKTKLQKYEWYNKD